MDHLPLPPGTEAPQVPYIGTDYDGGDFFGYPERQGVSDDLKTLDFKSRTPEECQAFFQTWLYFGFLTGVFKVVGLSVDTKRFVQKTNQGTFVTSKRLHVYLDEWKYRHASYRSDEQRLKIWAQIKSILDTVRETLSGPLQTFQLFLDEHSDACLPLWPNIALSIATLGWTLQQVSYMLYLPPNEMRQYKWGNNRVLRERLEQSLWCKAEIKRFLSNEGLDFLLYVGSIISPRAADDHGECTETVCRGKAANMREYRTKHTSDCPVDGCKFQEMPDSSIDIIKEGGIPLASWSDAGLEVLQYNDKSDMPYVAISHVWSDGKGNPERNALPECQLKDLQKKIEMLYSSPRRSPNPAFNLSGRRQLQDFQDPWRRPVGFWMDTLCVPVEEKHIAFRKQTIAQMRQIYEGADRVLVLDSWVEGLSVSSSVYDKTVRLYLSNWQHRLWTLQEGVMAHPVSGWAADHGRVTG
jgi:hypothetical protein